MTRHPLFDKRDSLLRGGCLYLSFIILMSPVAGSIVGGAIGPFVFDSGYTISFAVREGVFYGAPVGCLVGVLSGWALINTPLMVTAVALVLGSIAGGIGTAFLVHESALAPIAGSLFGYGLTYVSILFIMKKRESADGHY